MKNIIPTIREYRHEDFPLVRQLWLETGMGGAVRGDGPEAIQSTLSLGGRLLVLEDLNSGELMGTSWLTLDGRRIYMHHFGIFPRYQGLGYSKLLLDASLEFAESTGLQIKLEVHKNNKPAIQLYEKGGFQYLGNYLVYIIRDYQSILQS